MPRGWKKHECKLEGSAGKQARGGGSGWHKERTTHDNRDYRSAAPTASSGALPQNTAQSLCLWRKPSFCAVV